MKKIIILLLCCGLIIDEDAPVEDCTTMHQPRKQKKNTGPVMGGM